jgi:hypothetical protein
MRAVQTNPVPIVWPSLSTRVRGCVEQLAAGRDVRVRGIQGTGGELVRSGCAPMMGAEAPQTWTFCGDSRDPTACFLMQEYSGGSFDSSKGGFLLLMGNKMTMPRWKGTFICCSGCRTSEGCGSGQ